MILLPEFSRHKEVQVIHALTLSACVIPTYFGVILEKNKYNMAYFQ